jgi:hypothetical protein
MHVIPLRLKRTVQEVVYTASFDMIKNTIKVIESPRKMAKKITVVMTQIIWLNRGSWYSQIKKENNYGTKPESQGK